MRALSFGGGARDVRRSLPRAIALLAAVACGCGNVVTVEGTGGGGSTGTTTDTLVGGAGGETTTAGNGGTGGTGMGGSGTTTVLGCQSADDCVEDPGGPLCNPETGDCVYCIVSPQPALDCGVGQWCDPSKGTCEAGCTGDEDCPSAGASLFCDLATHSCKGCLVDTDCPIGAICLSDQCLPGCSLQQACEQGLTCCGSQCFDLSSDESNCGACNNFCPEHPWAIPICDKGQCLLGTCLSGHADCDGLWDNGCEHNTVAEGPCTCSPGVTESCYPGAPGTEGVGNCKAGTRTCNFDGLGWGPCQGQVLPAVELCASGADEDCDGSVDENVDLDGDGWGTCEGDCDDARAKVNPGALEITYDLIDSDGDPFTPPIKVYSGNGLDDDCDPSTPDLVEPPACSSTAKLTGVTAADLASAMELCQTAVANAPKPQKKWGLLSAQLLRADGTAPEASQLSDMMDKQTAVLANYGVSAPKVGTTFVGLSTGMMRDQDDPGAAPPSPGTDLGWTGSPPADYLAANFGSLPSSSGCSGACPSGAGANDGVTLRLAVRVPTNMYAFSFDFRVFTAGYPGAVCSGENDFFLARLTSAVPSIPVDKNVAFDPLGNTVSMNNTFFEVCAPAGCFTCPKGSADLAGTGMSAATSWLQADAPVEPGETITLDLSVFDVSTGTGDWVALVDGFRWHLPLGPVPFP